MSDPPSTKAEQGGPIRGLERLVQWATHGPVPFRLALPAGQARDQIPLGFPIAFGAIVTVLTFVAAYVAFVLFQNRYPDGVLEIWRRWDTIHYLSIARDGYGTDPDHRILIIWPPLYPWLMRVFRWAAGSLLGAGLFISFISYLAAIIGLYRLVGLDFPKRVAERSIIYISIFPVAYFLHAAYTESLFLALVVWSFVFARTRRWALAGLMGGLASMTRITAFGLLPAIAFEYLLDKRFKLRRIRPDLLWLLLIPMGFGVYLWVNYDVYGTPFAFMEMNRIQNHKVLSAPWVGAKAVWSSGLSYGPNRFLVVSVSEVAAGILSGLMALYVLVRLRTSYGVYMLLSWAIFACTSFWASTARYLIPLFPGFIVLAIWGERREVHWAMTVAFLMAYTMLLALFIRGVWAF
jgi:hypothetical protein